MTGGVGDDHPVGVEELQHADVQTWTAEQPITSRGPSGIGFVNFSDIKTLSVQAPIRTYGKGARGFNLYDGSLGGGDLRVHRDAR